MQRSVINVVHHWQKIHYKLHRQLLLSAVRVVVHPLLTGKFTVNSVELCLMPTQAAMNRCQRHRPSFAVLTAIILLARAIVSAFTAVNHSQL